jgi:hypothetical protein
LKERSNKILAELNKLNEVEKEREEQKRTRFGGIEVPYIPTLDYEIRSDGDRIIDALYAQEGNREFKIKVDALKKTKDDFSRLKNEWDLISDELMDVSYPKHALFGFLSFVLFAVLGVIIPLTYRLWGPLLLDISKQYSSVLPYLDSSNHIVVGLFSVGLAVNLCYILLEVYPALNRPRLRPRSERSQRSD